MNKRQWVVAAVLAAVAATALLAEKATAQAGPGASDPRTSATVLRPLADHPVSVRALTYAGADGQRQPLDLYFDPAIAGPRPVLLLNAGTGDAREWGGFRDFARLAAQRGFAALIAARRFPRGGEGIVTGQDDTAALVDQLGGLAPDVVDSGRACLWGFSGGGTTLAVAYRPAAKLACVIGFYPAVSLAPFAPDNAAWLARHSPAHVVRASGGPSSPPTLIVRAGRDTAQLNGMIADFAAAAAERNLPFELINLPDAVHGFDWEDRTDWAREAIERSFAFARRHTSAVRPRDEPLASVLVRLEEERQRAYVAGDRATLERHFAAEYLHSNLRGGTTDRKGELDFYAPGRFSLGSGTIRDVRTHDYGDSAVLTGEVEWREAFYRPAPAAAPIDLSGRYRITRSYVWRDGRWQVAASHASRIG